MSRVIVFFLLLVLLLISCSSAFEGPLENYVEDSSGSWAPPRKDGYLQFFPVWRASLNISGQNSTWSSPCFDHNVASLVTTSSGLHLQFEASHQRHTLSGKCADMYLIATRQRFEIRRVTHTGTHTLQLDGGWKPTERTYVEQYGLQVFLVQGGALGFVYDLYKTYQLFFSPVYSEMDSLQFLRDYVNWDPTPRNSTQMLVPDASEIHSGDVLFLFKFGPPHGGENAMEAYGTGGRSDHVAVFLWIDGVLYVTESIGGGGPDERSGIIRTEYRQWFAGASPAWMIDVCRLNPHRAALFDEEKAIRFFESVEGMPYGFHNYLFTWIDTPDANYPPPLSKELVPLFFSFVDKLDPTLSDEMWGQALNKRLNTTGLDMTGIFRVLEERQQSFYELVAMPEQDSWRYDGNQSLVCDTYVTKLLKEAGVFPGLDFEATEFTPLNLYQLDIYAAFEEWDQPAVCAQVPPQTPRTPWCQLSGQYYLDLQQFSTIQPYDHMFQRCETLPPDYLMTEGC